jgi:hypothetical protein
MHLIETPDFDIFQVQKETKGNELITVTTFLMHKLRVFTKFKIHVEVFMSFIAKIQSQYKDIAYHNKTHGADVCQTVYYYIETCQYKLRAHLDDLEICSIVLAGSCHDFEHPGFNNVYLVETKHSLALRYND